MKSEILEFKAKKQNAKPTSPLLYGLFLEDINHSIDGGLNANLIQNGNFDFCFFTYDQPVVKNKYDNLRFWEVEDSIVTNENPISENKPYSLKIELDGAKKIKNLGYELVGNKNYIYLNDNQFTVSFFYSSNKDVSCKIYFEYENGGTSKPFSIVLKKSSKLKYFF